jgi:thiamine phosphate synthase YjbQ (UPF0047 family)
MILLKNFFVDTTKGLDLLKIIHEVRRVVREGNTENGSVTIVIPSPGAGLTVLDPNDRPEDLKKTLEPHVASGLIKAILPKTLTLPFEKYKMLIEPWQEIFLIDYETSGRRREFKVQVEVETPPPAAAGKKGPMGPGGPPRA